MDTLCTIKRSSILSHTHTHT